MYFGIKSQLKNLLFEVALTNFAWCDHELWPCELDLRTLPILWQDEPAWQISRSKVIWFKSYCPNTQSHARRHTDPDRLLYL